MGRLGLECLFDYPFTPTYSLSRSIWLACQVAHILLPGSLVSSLITHPDPVVSLVCISLLTIGTLCLIALFNYVYSLFSLLFQLINKLIT